MTFSIARSIGRVAEKRVLMLIPGLLTGLRGSYHRIRKSPRNATHTDLSGVDGSGHGRGISSDVNDRAIGLDDGFIREVNAAVVDIAVGTSDARVCSPNDILGRDQTPCGTLRRIERIVGGSRKSPDVLHDAGPR